MTRRFDNLAAFARLTAAVCALALVFGDVARDLHLLLAEHVLCAAHGELVEAAEARGIAVRDVGSRAAVVPGLDTAEDHEHCRAQGAVTTGPSLIAFESSLPVARAAPLSIVLAFTPGWTRAGSVLDFAPKQGPPV